MRKAKNLNNRLTAILLSTAMMFAPILESMPVYAAESGAETEEINTGALFAASASDFSNVGGWNESIYAEIAGVKDADITEVSWSGAMTGNLTGDDLTYLVRDNGSDGVRIDIPGLKAGTYTLTVKAGGSTLTKSDIEVYAYDRSGYAHFNYTDGVGAYNDDGTLKENAIVLYITDENKNTVSLKYGNTTVKGIGNILNDTKIFKNFAEAGKPLVVRFIGCVSETGLYKRGNYNAKDAGKIDGLTDYVAGGDNGHMARIQSGKDITLEGIGYDAVIDGWGFHYVAKSDSPNYGKSFEVRNLTFINTPEDAVGMEGAQADSNNVNSKLSSSVERCWIHHNEFYCPEITNPAEDDKAEGDGSVDFKRGQYFTCSYNYFDKCHKTNLVGANKNSLQYNMTYHHNYWYMCKARGPLARNANIHMYNNIVEMQRDYVQNARANSYIFSEYNLFYASANPQNIDGGSDGNGVIKSYHDSIASVIKMDNPAEVVQNKTDYVENNCQFSGENIKYDKFDTDSTLSYIPDNNYKLDTDFTELRKVVASQTGVQKQNPKRPEEITAGEYSVVPEDTTINKIDALPKNITPGKVKTYAFTVNEAFDLEVAYKNADTTPGVLVNEAGENLLTGDGSLTNLPAGTYMIQAKNFQPWVPASGSTAETAFSFKEITINTLNITKTTAHVHKWVLDSSKSVSATCTVAGKNYYTCEADKDGQKCNETKEEPVAALGHSWSEWTVDKPATETATGQKSRVCIRCDAKETETIPVIIQNTSWDFAELNPTTDIKTIDGVKYYAELILNGNVSKNKDYLLAKEDATITIPNLKKGDKVIVKYCYEASFTLGETTVDAKSGSTSQIDKVEHIVTADGPLVIKNNSTGKYATQTYFCSIEIVKAENTTPYTSVLSVGQDKDYNTIGDALAVVRKMTRTADQKVTIMIDPGNYEEMLVIDMPNIILQNASATPSIELKNKGVDIDENAVRVTWYYGHGYTYYSMDSNCKYDAGVLAANKSKGFASFTNPGAGTTDGSYWNATVIISANNFTAKDIIFENSFNQYVSAKSLEDVIEAQTGKEGAKEGTVKRADMKTLGDTKVQEKEYVERAAALAITNNCKEVYFNNCKFVGRQDTLYGGTGVTAGFEYCSIYGGTDYIFGGMTAVFKQCDLVFNTNDQTEQGLKNDVGYITAPQQTAGRGYLMYKCTVTSTVPGVDTASAHTSKPGYLGRPWKANTGEAVFYKTTIEKADSFWNTGSYSYGESLICSEGWGDGLGGQSALCGEYGTIEESGVDNSSKRASWSKVFTEEKLTDGTPISIKSFLKDWEVPFDSDDSNVPVPKQYTITIDRQNGTAPEVKTVAEGTALTEEDLPSTLTKEGYTFLGWVDEEGNAITVPYTPAKSMTIKAKWQQVVVKNQYVITIDRQDGTEAVVKTVVEGTELTEEDLPSTIAKEGYTFLGWVDEDGNAITVPYTPTKSMTIKAEWQEVVVKNQYVITIDKQDGTEPVEKVIEEGTELTEEDLPSTLTREGYTFLGWVDEEGNAITVPYTPTKSMTIKAKWQSSTTEPKIGLHVELAVPDKTYVYTGSAIKPAIIVTNNGELLTEGVDYTVKYSNNIKACEWGKNEAAPKNAPKIIVTGKGNLTGSTFANFRIEKKDIGEADITGDTASVKAGAVTVTKGSKAVPVLVYNGVKLGTKDYTYNDPTQKNRKFGDASKEDTETFEIELEGTGNYKGSRKVTVKAVKKDVLKTFTVTVSNIDLTYNGAPQLLPADAIIVKDKTTKETLKNDSEHTYYEIEYGSDTTNAGIVKFSVVGVGEYTGTVSKTYKIKPLKDNSKFYVDQSSIKKSYDYNSAGVTLGEDLEVYYGKDANGTKLQEGADYKVTYSSNKKVGKGKYTITFLGNFKGSKKTGEFDIGAASLKTSGAKVEAADKVFKKAGVYKSATYVTIDGVALKASDYKAEYYIVNADGSRTLMGGGNKVTTAGTVIEVKVTGKGSYKTGDEDSVTGYYTVCDKADRTDLSGAKVTFYEKNADGRKGRKLTKLEYTGMAVEPAIVEVTVKGQTEPLKQDVDYTLRYVNNKNKGKATVIITAAENSDKYVGSKTATFSIVARNLKNQTGLLNNLFNILGR